MAPPQVDSGFTPGGHFGLAARLQVRLPGIDPEVAKEFLDLAHQTCPYSRATRGNIDVTIRLK